MCNQPWQLYPDKAEPIQSNTEVSADGALLICFYNEQNTGSRVLVNGLPIYPSGSFCMPVIDNCQQIQAVFEVRWDTAPTTGALHVVRYRKLPPVNC